MKWYRYLALLLAGAFSANAVPHFVNGISGEPFPSPFADPPGFGDSSPLTNVLWGSANMAVGYLLARHGRLAANRYPSLVLYFLGVITMGVVLSQGFSNRT